MNKFFLSCFFFSFLKLRIVCITQRLSLITSSVFFIYSIYLNFFMFAFVFLFCLIPVYFVIGDSSQILHALSLPLPWSISKQKQNERSIRQ